MAYAPGKGTTLSLTIAATPTVLTQVVSITPPSMEMGMSETTHLGSTWRAFLANIPDGGEFTFELEYDSAAATHAAVWSQFVLGTEAVWLITLADTGTTTIGFSAPISGFAISDIVVDDIVKLTVSAKVTGAVTITP
jgi:hypothetical protein